jgi:hypothetical protein
MQKCPSCKAELSPNTGVCDYCGFIINQTADKSIDNLSNDVEATIKSMKLLPAPSIWASLTKNAKISMPIFTIVAFMLSYKINGLFLIPGIVFFLYSLISIFKKRVDPIAAVNIQKAEFEEKIRTLENLYGNDNKIKSQIQQFQNELKLIDKSIQKGKLLEWLSYFIIVFLFAFALLIPAPKSTTEVNSEMLQSESAIVLKATDFINENNLVAANNLLLNIKSLQNTIDLKSKIQLKEIENKLFIVESEIGQKNIKEAVAQLDKIGWVKISTSYDAEQFEEKYYKQFIQLKTATNNRLPESDRVTVEDEFNF